MKLSVIVVLCLIAAVLGGLAIWRQLDHRADRNEIRRLILAQRQEPAVFDPAMVADLPEPARRYFEYAILPGTALFTVADIDMTGQFSLGSRESPGYIPMRARQILAAPQGFIWKMAGGAGMMSVSGSDSASWTRFWLAGLLPVARAGGTSDHRRAAFGRMVSEAAIWTPAALLLSEHVTWEALDDDTARATIREGSVSQQVDVTVDGQGQPRQVSFMRWSDANAKKTYQLQPFGGYLSDFREVSGFRLPMHVEAGNFFGTDAYFPFFIADVTQIRFPRLP